AGAPLSAAHPARILPRRRRVLTFDVVRLSARSRGSVGERPLHTRKVAGSIPAGTTRSERYLPMLHNICTTVVGVFRRETRWSLSSRAPNFRSDELMR